MQIKDILLYLDDGASNEVRTEAVFDLARTHNAQITGVTLSALRPKNEIISNEDALMRMSQKAATRRCEEFLETAKNADIPAISHIVNGDQSESVRKMAQYARNFDLVVLRQTNPDSENASVVGNVAEQVILHSGRPVFFMPYIGAHRIPMKKAAIAWDGTPSASRALHDAIPLLQGLTSVMLVIIEGSGKTAKGELMADDMCRHLSHHGIIAVVNRCPRVDADVPTILLNEIVDNDIDLLVMGGYGTPSLKQKIFGGVTRTILSSMLVPVLMSH